MLNLSQVIDLPLVSYLLIATAIFLYVFLDRFDLGVGILFPFAPSDKCRDRMMVSIAPFWDGNETWLVLGGGGMLAAFPLAYAIIMPAFYMPVIIMLLGLILRGVSFEFRFKAQDRSRRLWDVVFHFGSLVAAFAQGAMLGAFVQGIEVSGRAFAGGAWDWLNAFSVMTGLALIFGYALLGVHMAGDENRRHHPVLGSQERRLSVRLCGHLHRTGQSHYASDERRYQGAVVQPSELLLSGDPAAAVPRFFRRIMARSSSRQ